MGPVVLKRTLLGLGECEETFPFGTNTSVFKVRGKMFALTHLAGRPLKVSLKCDPELGERLRESYSAIVPGYHLNKRHWITITVGELPDRMVRDLIEDSYDLVVAALPRAARLALTRG